MVGAWGWGPRLMARGGRAAARCSGAASGASAAVKPWSLTAARAARSPPDADCGGRHANGSRSAHIYTAIMAFVCRGRRESPAKIATPDKVRRGGIVWSWGLDRSRSRGGGCRAWPAAMPRRAHPAAAAAERRLCFPRPPQVGPGSYDPSAPEASAARAGARPGAPFLCGSSRPNPGGAAFAAAGPGPGAYSRPPALSATGARAGPAPRAAAVGGSGGATQRAAAAAAGVAVGAARQAGFATSAQRFGSDREASEKPG
jgi:hypothetical protein